MARYARACGSKHEIGRPTITTESCHTRVVEWCTYWAHTVQKVLKTLLYASLTYRIYDTAVSGARTRRRAIADLRCSRQSAKGWTSYKGFHAGVRTRVRTVDGPRSQRRSQSVTQLAQQTVPNSTHTQTQQYTLSAGWSAKGAAPTAYDSGISFDQVETQPNPRICLISKCTLPSTPSAQMDMVRMSESVFESGQ